ncbi:hypothetical protein HID58_087696, partial [Brassica napus]
SDIPIIQKIYLPYHPVPDGIICPYTSDGNYFINSRCQHLVNSVIAWKSRFLSTSFVHVHRQNNGPADLLAKKSIISPTDWSLFQSCPVFLYNNICADNN